MGYGGRACIHGGDGDGVGDGVPDDPGPGMAVDAPGRRFAHLVAEAQGGSLVAEVADGDLTRSRWTSGRRTVRSGMRGARVRRPTWVRVIRRQASAGAASSPATLAALRRRSVRNAIPGATSRARLAQIVRRQSKTRSAGAVPVRACQLSWKRRSASSCSSRPRAALARANSRVGVAGEEVDVAGEEVDVAGEEGGYAFLAPAALQDRVLLDLAVVAGEQRQASSRVPGMTCAGRSPTACGREGCAPQGRRWRASRPSRWRRAPVGRLPRRAGAGLFGRAPPELRDAGMPENAGNGGGAGRTALACGELPGDLRGGEVLAALQFHNARVAIGSRRRPRRSDKKKGAFGAARKRTRRLRRVPDA